MSEVRFGPVKSAFTFPMSWSISSVFVFGPIFGLFCVSTALPTDNLFRKARPFGEGRMSRLELIWEPNSLRAWSPDQALTAPPIGWGVRKIGADSVWAAGVRGAGVVVAILDSGVRYTHVDLADHLWINADEIPDNGIDDDLNGFVDDYIGYDFIDDDPDPMDDFGHGTFVAGLAVGNGTAGFTTGVAPDAMLMSLKISDSLGNISGARAVQALYYAAENGADIVCMVFGGYRWLLDEWRSSCRFAAEYCGVLSVAAAWGGGIPPYPVSPACVPPPWLHPDQTLRGEPAGLIAVARTDSFDEYHGDQIGPAEWSDFPYVPGDPDSIGLIKPDLTAPGGIVVSLDYTSDTAYVQVGSSGAANAAGAAALLRSACPSLTPAEIDSFLEMTAVDLGDPGKDNFYGAGRVDVWAAYQYCVPGIEEETRRDTHSRLVEAPRLECIPNPSYGPVTISYFIDDRQSTTIQIFDLAGRIRQEILITDRASGQGTIHWDGRDSAGRKLPSGIYFVRLSAGSQTFSQKITLMN